MKKFGVLIVLTLLLSGCTLNYNLNIDNNMIFTEKIKVTESNSVISKFALYASDYVDTSINDYTNDPDYGNYTIKKTTNNDVSGGIATATYMDFNQFRVQDKLKDYFFSDVEMSTDGNIITLEFTSNTTNTLLSNNSSEETTVNTDGAALNKANISITLPFKVINSNADKVDKKNNTYTWTYDTMNQDKSITLSFDKSKKVIIIDIPSWVYVLVVLVLFFAGLGWYIYHHYKKNSLL